MGKIKLGYWNIRGLGQIPRLLSAYVGTELQQTRYTEFNKWHGEDKLNLGLDFPNLPYLIDGEFKLTESSAIIRYIILQSGHNQLLGKTVRDRARVENVLGVLKDALKEIRALYWNKEYVSAKAAALQKAKTKFDYLESFVGNKKWALGYLTLVDFEIAEASYYLEAAFPEQYSQWSFWQTIRQNFNALPEIQAYYKRADAVLEPFLPPQYVTIQPKFNAKLILGYWGVRGLGQQIRLILSHVGLAFDQKIYTSREEWFETDKNKIGFSFPNIPYLIDGQFKLTESSAIQKYVIDKSGRKDLLGKNIQDIARVQNILGLLEDVFTELAKNFWKKDDQVIKQTLEKITPKLGYLAKFIESRNTALEYLTLVDFALAERSHYLQFLYPEQYKSEWQFLARIRDNINSLESTKAYYARQNSVKGPFMPPTAFLNPSAEQYK